MGEELTFPIASMERSKNIRTPPNRNRPPPEQKATPTFCMSLNHMLGMVNDLFLVGWWFFSNPGKDDFVRGRGKFRSGDEEMRIALELTS